MRLLRVVLLLALSATASSASGELDVAVLQGLDKITARITTIEAPLGQAVKLGTLRIVARRYGPLLLRGLPRCQRITDPEEACAFLREQAPPRADDARLQGTTSPEMLDHTPSD